MTVEADAATVWKARTLVVTSASDHSVGPQPAQEFALAVELEQLGEGQRFMTKLLADRVPVPSPQPGSVPASRPPTA